MSQQYRSTILVNIYPFLQGRRCRKAIFQQSKPWCDFENGVKVTKIASSFACHNKIAVQVRSKSIHSFRRQRAEKPFSNNLSLSVILKMGPKSNQFFSMSQQYRCTSLVKTYPFIEVRCSPCPHNMGSRSPNSNQFFTCPTNIDVQVWSKSIYFSRKEGADKAFFSHFPTI